MPKRNRVGRSDFLIFFFGAFVFGVNWGTNIYTHVLNGDTSINGDVPVSRIIKS